MPGLTGIYVLKPDPGVAFLDIIQFLNDLLVGMAGLLYLIPEAKPFLQIDFPVSVDVNGIEHFPRVEFGEVLFPS